MSEQEFMDFRSKYLDIAIGNVDGVETPSTFGEPEIPYGDDRTLDDIDFYLELLHSDVINVAYILELIADLNPSSADYHQRRKDIIDTMIKDAAMRNKAKLIDGFIQQNVDNDIDNFKKSKADGSVDLESKLAHYIAEARNRAVTHLAEEEGVDEKALVKFLEEYDYLQREKPEILQNAIRHKKVGFKERRNLLKRLLEKLRAIIEMFNWE
jgi:type I restriction enzyme R subunit